MLDNFPDKLSQAVLHTVAYSDIFDYPLTAREIHRYLTGVKASFEEVAQALEAGPVTRTGGYFTLPGREEIVSVRAEREVRSHQLLPRAIRYGRVLGTLPYIRMVALTGSLAVMNVSESADFDYMLVAARGRVWTARAFALAFNRLTRLRGHTICPNLIVSETALAWPLHDLYSARELYQMIPVTGMDMYNRLLNANHWAKEFLPNCSHDFSREQRGTAPVLTDGVRKVAATLKAFIELPLHGKLGDRFENWEMDRKIVRFQKQAGYGDETIFTAEICQGNFHHHRKWTKEVLGNKLTALDIFAATAIPSGDMTVNRPPSRGDASLRTVIGARVK
jgi:hypothetical protein